MTIPSIDHIGIIVDDLEASVSLMQKILPGAPMRRKSLPEVGLQVVEFEASNIIVELLQYTSDEESFARQTMGSATGINHLSVSVSDIDKALDELSKEGVRAMAGFPMQGAHGRIAFLTDDPRLKAKIELCQVDSDQVDDGA